MYLTVCVLVIIVDDNCNSLEGQYIEYCLRNKANVFVYYITGIFHSKFTRYLSFSLQRRSSEWHDVYSKGCKSCGTEIPGKFSYCESPSIDETESKTQVKD